MKRWSLRTRLTAVLATAMIVFSALSAISYLTADTAEARLESAFAAQLSMLSELPTHRSRLRRIDIDTDNYLLTRRDIWLKRRGEAAEDFRVWHLRMARRLESPEELAEWRAIGVSFESYLASQDAAIAATRKGTLTSARALESALSNSAVDALIERMSRFGRVSFSALDARRRAARTAALNTFGFILIFGLAMSTALAAAVASILVSPVYRLREQARRWSLGTPWELSSPKDAPPELDELMSAMKTMAEKLNEQYDRERASSRLKSQLVSGVSHEFNNALTVIHAAHVMLREQSPATANTQTWHDMMAGNIRALSTMATNLLNLGRLESGHFALEPARMDLAALLRESLRLLELLALRREQKVSLRLPESVPHVRADLDALRLVVTNLLSNAIKYTPQGGDIELGARTLPDGSIEVWVQDTGIGVAPEDKQRIMSGWYRTEEGRRTAKGFGVGLALARMILDAHDSELKLESEPGKGARFSFTLKPWDGRPDGRTIG